MFKGIEGLRGWLAWAVVLTHLAGYSALMEHRIGTAVVATGSTAVRVFIIVSGFVIAHLLLGKRESYRIYILRRVLRIYPAYLVALLIGILVAPLAFDLVGTVPMRPKDVMHMTMQHESLAQHPIAHLLLHLSLLHGIVSNTILMESQYLFVKPAWSLSLEWQFYLIAPVFVGGVLRRPTATAAIVIILFFAYRFGVFGSFYNPSVLPGAAWQFLIGIGTRIGFDRLPRFERYPWGLLIGAIPIGFYHPELRGVFLWLGMVLYLLSTSNWRCFDGSLARALGARSYSVYILHMPIVVAVAWTVYRKLQLSGWSATALMAVTSIVLVVIAAELAYRFVERPAIALGKKLGREPGPASQGW